MPTTPSATLVFPEIDRSELEAVRRFLTGDSGVSADRPARPASPVIRERKSPTVRTGITRARFRSAARAAE